MNIALVHHHLERGGVTQVMRSQINALLAADVPLERLAVLHGGRASAYADCPVRQVVVPELEYAAQRSPADLPSLAAAVANALRTARFSSGETVVHVHNPTLGKLPFLPSAVAQLANAGFACLLQIHDFAEDYRPGNFGDILAAHGLSMAGPQLDELLYPCHPRMAYATLTQRDANILLRAGAAPHQVHWLPNPVSAPALLGDAESAKANWQEQFGTPVERELVVYPVRGIRRKNVGELLALSLLFPERTYAITLRPQNPVEAESYEHWRRLAKKLALPVVFDAGEGDALGYEDILAAADALCTTSVAEGFGMVFLESPLLAKPLLGRDLPDITADFRAAGVAFPQLAEQLLVPIPADMRASLQGEADELFAACLAGYGQSPPAAATVPLASPPTPAGWADFGRLGPAGQTELLTRLSHDASLRNQAIAANGTFATIEQAEPTQAEVIRREYSRAKSADRLLAAYESLLAAKEESPGHISVEEVLAQFLAPARFHPVRVA